MDFSFYLFLLFVFLTGLWMFFNKANTGSSGPSLSPAAPQLVTGPAGKDGVYHRTLFTGPENDGHALRKVLAHIDEAKSSIWIVTSSLSGGRIGKSLREASKRGVKVKIILESPPLSHDACSLPFLRRNALDVLLFQNSDTAAACALDGPNARRDASKTTETLSRIFHQKFMVVDNKFVVYGSSDLSEDNLRRHGENLTTTNDQRIYRPFVEKFDLFWTQASPSVKVLANQTGTVKPRA